MISKKISENENYKGVLTAVVRHLHTTVPILMVASIMEKFADCMES